MAVEWVGVNVPAKYRSCDIQAAHFVMDDGGRRSCHMAVLPKKERSYSM